MRQIEKAIQDALVLWIQETYLHIIVTTTGNEKFYKGIIASIGITDLILFDMSDGGVLFLELKKKKGKLLPSQIAWNTRFDACHPPNYSRAIGYGFLEAKETIQQWATATPATTP